MKLRFLVPLLAVCLFAHPAFGAQTKVRLLLDTQSAKPGETILAGVQMQMPFGWHTYWTNAGDSGSAAEIEWKLPEGITAGAVQWPVPEKHVLPAGDQKFITYIYETETVLLVPLKLSADLPPGEKTISAKISWQECETVCVLGSKSVSATFLVGNDHTPSPSADLISAAQKNLPQKDPSFPITSKLETSGDTAQLVIDLSPPATGQWDFFPYAQTSAEISGETKAAPAPSGAVQLQKSLKKSGANWPAEIMGVLVRLENGKPTAGYEVSLKPEQPTPAVVAAAATGSANTSLATMLLFAFIGGLILNIMPCVLPVIALKVLSFVNQSKESPGRTKVLGLVYGLGVLASFLVLAGLAIAVKSAGQEASWGMALQNQIFRVVLTVLITLVALNLFGVFEITLSGKVMGAAGNLSAKEGMAGAFFNGILATILATPCTAPFLTGAIGFAFTQSAMTILLVFVMVGLGLAAPFVLLCWQPRWLKILPKPGAWMEKFKIAMGFPMLATAVWIFWFTAPRFGKTGVLWLGLFLVVLAAAAWVWGEFVQRGRSRKPLAIAISLLLLGTGYIFALEKNLHWRTPTTYSADSGSLKEGADGIDWQRWSPEAVAQARSEGYPVLVDFTADNCLNCQVNKVTSLEIPGTRSKLKEIGAVAFLGDFTDADPRIAAELKVHQRAGVPLVLVYPRDQTAPTIVLPPILTPQIVMDALEQAAK